MSSSDRYPFRHAEPEMDGLAAIITGAGAANPSSDSALGNGFTVTWVSTGLYEIAFPVGTRRAVATGKPAFWASTITDVDGWDVVFGVFNESTRKLRFSVLNQAQTLADLPAATGLHLSFNVKKTTQRG